MKLEEIRADIDKADKELLGLFERRMALALEVAKIKAADGAAIYRPEREKEILDRAGKSVPSELMNFARSFFSSLMLLSREKQYLWLAKAGKEPQICRPFLEGKKKKAQAVCYYGDECSWSNLAAAKTEPQAMLYGAASFDAVFEAVASGEADAGILPIENSTAGTVREVYDLLLKYRLSITASCTLDIKYVLAGPAGASEKTIKYVYSHPQALAQCKGYIEKKGYRPAEFANTAGAARLVAGEQDPSKAALCSAYAAKKYGLCVVEEDIRDVALNTTRFIEIAPPGMISDGADTVSIVFTLPDESGTLAQVLNIFKDAGLNVIKIESRPIPHEKFHYFFYLDFNGNLKEPHVRGVMLQLEQEIKEIYLLGNYKLEA